MFKLIANSAAICSLASNIIEAGKMGCRQASAGAKAELAIKDIRDYTGDSLLNVPSDKYNSMKKIMREGDATAGLFEAKGAIKGFFRGALEGMRDNWLPAIFSVTTLFAKSKTVKTIGLVGMAATTAWNLIANGTNLFVDKDAIEK